jgi:hypothetical protein
MENYLVKLYKCLSRYVQEAQDCSKKTLPREIFKLAYTLARSVILFKERSGCIR